MKLGTTIRKLRHQRDLTQEQLAEYLNVTVSAVSQCEPGASTPGIAMLAPLTRLFHVSADELLCLNDSPEDKRYNELLAAYDQTYKTEDFAKRQKICDTRCENIPAI